MEIWKQLGNKIGVAACYTNLGLIYQSSGRPAEARKHYQACLAMMEDIGDKQGMATAHGNMGNIYSEERNYPGALTHYQACIKLSEDIGDQRSICIAYNSTANVYNHLRKGAEARQWAQKALIIAKETGSLGETRTSYACLAKADSLLGNYKGALTNYIMWVACRDSIENATNTKKTVQIQMQYEFDKKESATRADQERKDVLAAAENRKHKLIIFGVSAGLLLLLILAIVIFRSLRLNQEKNRIITQQKAIVDEKQRAILDSIHYAQKIQNSLLTSEKYIDKELKKFLG